MLRSLAETLSFGIRKDIDATITLNRPNFSTHVAWRLVWPDFNLCLGIPPDRLPCGTNALPRCNFAFC